MKKYIFNCSECGSKMDRLFDEMKSINGKSRISVVYKCTNPECGAIEAINIPLD